MLCMWALGLLVDRHTFCCGKIALTFSTTLVYALQERDSILGEKYTTHQTKNCSLPFSH